MSEIFRQIPLYRFVMFCNDVELEKKVLDCGAGGNCPPLSLFYEHSYLTQGIEFSPNQLKEANIFASKKNQNLNIEQGDMRSLKFENESFSFVYSFNSVFHMTKEEVEKSINEMKRVLKKNGLLFVNFLTTSDFRCGEGTVLGKNQYEQIEDNVPTIHSYFEESEPDKYFEKMKVLHKEIRIVERIYEGEKIKQGFVDYIVKKI